MDELTTREASQPFSSTAAALVLREACSVVGASSTNATLMRLGENAIFSVQHPSLVVRIARSRGHLRDAEKEVRVARWLERCEVPAARLYPVEQPILVGAHPVTFWRKVADTGDKASASALGAALRLVHDCGIDDAVGLPRLDIFGRVGDRLSKAANVSPEVLNFLHSRLGNLRTAYAALSFPSPPVALHGDAHVKNLICTPDNEAILIDFEAFCFGPPEVDLSVTATEYEIGWHSPEDYHAFCEAYGADVREWSGFQILRDINLFKMTTWLMQNVGESDLHAEEFDRRLATLRRPTARSQWQPF
ncbi:MULTISPECIES: phosphotransferase family protein [unclassified Micromonospora]|uniref:phosphotransferase family protein n=1 Tax=unclassified Micromonospora TaxID=2617518 RepID=UPI001E44C86A|nr:MULTISPECIES: aminoglycoside phosphotransferase family protein [unclassified Micromonospora]